jgi:hypothetical protein
MESKFDEVKEYNLFLDFLLSELKDRDSNICKTILNDLESIRGNYTQENKRKITGMVFMIRELESIQLPIFSEWWKYFKN